jgi:hypothetical protein
MRRSLFALVAAQLTDRIAESTARFSVVLWKFDSESYPRHGSSQAVAFLLVGMGDIEEQPVGALIWSSEAVTLTLEKVADTWIRITSTGSNQACVPVSVEVRMLADGTVIAGNQILGKVQ